MDPTACRGRRLVPPAQIGGHHPRHQLDATMRIQLIVQTFHVRLHRAPGQAQSLGNIVVAAIRHHVPNHNRLTRRQAQLASDARPRLLAKKVLRTAKHSGFPRPVSWDTRASHQTSRDCCRHIGLFPVRDNHTVLKWATESRDGTLSSVRRIVPNKPAARLPCSEVYAVYHVSCELASEPVHPEWITGETRFARSIPEAALPSCATPGRQSDGGTDRHRRRNAAMPEQR